jgi:hypothetical protein
VPFPWPDARRRLMFYQQRGTEEISSSGTSYVNRQESVAVEKIVTLFLSHGVAPEQIGVITPYEGQRAQARLCLRCRRLPHVHTLFRGVPQQICACMRSSRVAWQHS